jgi:hypothetical protein
VGEVDGEIKEAVKDDSMEEVEGDSEEGVKKDY